MYCSAKLRGPRTLIPHRLRGWLGARLCPRPPLAPDATVFRACIFTVGQVGDFVLALSAVRRLLAEYGEDRCVLVVTPATAPLAQREFPAAVRTVLPADAPSLMRDIVPLWRREQAAFAGRRFERLVCFSHQRSLYYELALSWIHAGHDLRMLPSTYPQEPADGMGTELLAHWQLTARALGRQVPRAHMLPEFRNLPASNDRRLLVFPFSRDPTRNLPTDTLLHALAPGRTPSSAAIVLSGGPGDRPRLEQLASHLPGAEVETPPDLEGLLRQIAAAGLVFSADSAPSHIAIALDKPTVTMTNTRFHGYAQPWTRSNRQCVFIHGAAPAEVAGALIARFPP